MTKYADSLNIAETNRSFYNALWSNSYMEHPERFNTWPLISELLPAAPDRLEIGPGLRPRLPVEGTHFIDISAPAIERLQAGGGAARQGEICELPYSERKFDLVCAFDVIEHVWDDRQAFAELSRVLKDGGILIFSVPLHAHLWTEFDEWAGHARRYDPGDLLTILSANNLVPEKSAAFGMQPSNPKLMKFGMWFLKHSQREAMFFYNRVFMPLGIHFQKSLKIMSGFMDTTGVDEIVFVCRRGSRPLPVSSS
ncbi:MAG: methyltransferase domain-containing protein [Desulfuromonadaceae bacterium]|nr:methyltransferase domain-containing protein [Desulfuromonadaceae bacterium]